MRMMQQAEIMNNPVSTYKQLSRLYDMGLEDYEIQYLLYLKLKEQLREKWE